MALTREFFTFLTCTFMIMVFHSTADHYPPPEKLSYDWLDAFTVNLSWKMPEGLPENSDVCFEVQNIDDGSRKCVKWRNSTESLLTEKMTSDNWTYNIWTVIKTSGHSSESNPMILMFGPRKPRGKLVTDFKCLIQSRRMNCSWIPVNQLQKNVTVSYRACGPLAERIKQCDTPYSNGQRNGCYLNADGSFDVCVLVETETAMSTFKAVAVAPPPELVIQEEGDHLKLSWPYSETADRGNCNYEVCYKQCNNPEKCMNTSGEERMMKVPYDKNCFYEFRCRTLPSKYSRAVFSDFGKVATYGVNQHPDRTLTVIAIVIPIVLFICVILSCYCFRRYSAVICPTIPDPSAIFKEMMMNNKEDKTTTGLYTPVPEPVEPCKVTLVAEELRQNS